MTNYVIRLRTDDYVMCVSVCERKREIGSYTYEHKIKWGMIDYIKKCHQVTKIRTMRYI